MTADAHRLMRLYDLRAKVEAEIKRVESLRRRRPRPKQKVAACGTDGGYYRHVRTTKTPTCDDCKAAHSAYETGRAQRRRKAA